MIALRSSIGVVVVLASSIALAGCREKLIPEPDFERMVRQEKYDIWTPCEFFPDGRTMQLPPEGTLASDEVVGRPGYTDGVVGGAYVSEIPVPLTVPFVQRGRDRYEIFCATCHGMLGDGRSRVAMRMTLREPPSLVGDKVKSFPPGRIYQSIVEGYGLMPRYADSLPIIEDRWAVVAYITALGRSRAVEARSLPPEFRAPAEEVLR